jgi:hypothetical protein
LLHGLARAGVGHLNEDWLANTHDPTPVFSWVVATIFNLAGPFGLHALFFLLLGAYFEGVRRMIEALPGMPESGAGRSLFLLLFLTVHACVPRVASAELTGVDWPWYLQAGLAAQYLLGPGLQPSVFGVLLILSLAAYAHHRPITAAGLAAGAAVMHSTYLLPAGLLVLGYLVSLTWHGLPRIALAAGILALAIVAPVLAYDLRSFVGGDSELLPEAQHILADVRIPHHAVVTNWLDAVAWVQIAIMTAGLFAIRRTRLFLPLAVPTVVGAILTVVEVQTKNEALALLFPWRFSVVLMPVAVAVLLARLAAAVGRRMDRPAVIWTCFGIAVLLAATGGWVTWTARGYRVNEAEEPLLDHVREHAEPGRVYLLPVKFATLKKETPTSQSKTFVPPVQTGQVGIPVDLQRFRLATGEPIYVDFKAVPYAPAEVIEWARRVQNCERWYKAPDWDASGAISEVIAAGITHVIATADKVVTSRRLGLVYADDRYRVYRVKIAD